MTQKPFILCDFDIAALTPGPSPKGRGEIFKTRSKRPSRIPYFVRSIIRAVRSRKYEVPSLKCRTCNTKHATPSGKPGARNTRRTGAIRLPSPLSFFIMHILGKISSWLKVNVGWDQRSAVPPEDPRGSVMGLRCAGPTLRTGRHAANKHPCPGGGDVDALPCRRDVTRFLGGRRIRSRHTPCAVRKLRHTECAYYIAKKPSRASRPVAFTMANRYGTEGWPP